MHLRKLHSSELIIKSETDSVDKPFENTNEVLKRLEEPKSKDESTEKEVSHRREEQEKKEDLACRETIPGSSEESLIPLSTTSSSIKFDTCFITVPGSSHTIEVIKKTKTLPNIPTYSET